MLSLNLLGCIFWGPCLSVTNVMEIHPTVVEIFQPGPQWWTDRSANIPPAMMQSKITVSRN